MRLFLENIEITKKNLKNTYINVIQIFIKKNKKNLKKMSLTTTLTSPSSSILTKPKQRLLQSSYCSCSKFVPQAFNLNKCQQCFNLKDMHTNEALAEFSKVSPLTSFSPFKNELN